jgi:hypothetical protein
MLVEVEVPPPGEGVITDTDNVPGEASCAAGTVTVNWVVLSKVVVRAAAPNWTVDCGVKPDPVTVTTVSALPGAIEFGEIEASAGAGLFIWTEAEAVLVESVVLVAVIVTVLGEGGTAGAV